MSWLENTARHVWVPVFPGEKNAVDAVLTTCSCNKQQAASSGAESGKTWLKVVEHATATAAAAATEREMWPAMPTIWMLHLTDTDTDTAATDTHTRQLYI